MSSLASHGRTQCFLYIWSGWAPRLLHDSNSLVYLSARYLAFAPLASFERPPLGLPTTHSRLRNSTSMGQGSKDDSKFSVAQGQVDVKERPAGDDSYSERREPLLVGDNYDLSVGGLSLEEGECPHVHSRGTMAAYRSY